MSIDGPHGGPSDTALESLAMKLSLTDPGETYILVSNNQFRDCGFVTNDTALAHCAPAVSLSYYVNGREVTDSALLVAEVL